MTSHCNPDRESFQKLLADAFAVQESGINTPSLLALVELERSIATPECDVDQLLHLVAEDVRKVADASGTAIALLKSDQLVYRAGTGTAATYVGRPVRAVLSVSARSRSSNEILRVENAKTDVRIEAEICRQFGAGALLIIPIYQKDVLAGVLEIMFNDAHAFQIWELHTYRLMAGLVSDALFGGLPPGQKKAAAKPATTIAHHVKSMISLAPSLPKVETLVAPASKNLGGKRSGFTATVRIELSGLSAPLELLTKIKHVVQRVTLKKLWWNVPVWKGAASAAGIALIVVTLIEYSHHPAGSTASKASKSNTAAQPTLLVPAKPSASVAYNATKPSTVAAGKPPKFALNRRRESQNGIEYIGDDVTIRHFSPKLSASRLSTANKELRFGDDVTVRSFVPSLGSASQTGAAVTQRRQAP